MKAQDLIKILELFPEREVLIKDYYYNEISEIRIDKSNELYLVKGEKVEDEE